MGEITKAADTSRWMKRVEGIRNELIATTRTGNRVAAAFAMADARAELIESLKDEQIQARLLRITDPDLAMVELVNNPNDQDRVRICAMALLGGLVPGEDQFAIFGGGFDKRERKPRPGKLYIKEAGYKVLFSHLGISPDVVTTHPEYVPFGDGDKRVWRVGGTAACELAGNTYEVRLEGKTALGIPGYESDNVAGVAAKARRRLLQALWGKVSPIVKSEVADDEDAEPEAAGNIEQQPERTTGRDWAAEIKQHEASSPGLRDYMTAIRDAETVEEVDASLSDSRNGDAVRFGGTKLVRDYANHRKSEIVKQQPSPPVDKSDKPSHKPSTARTAFVIYRDMVDQCNDFDALESLSADIQSSDEPISKSERDLLKKMMEDRASQLHDSAEVDT